MVSLRSLFGPASCAALLAVAMPFAAMQPVSAKPIVCPDTWVGTKCDYYKDGFKAGRQDRKAGLSMAYERHDGAYDSQNASYYQAGYESGWSGN